MSISQNVLPVVIIGGGPAGLMAASTLLTGLNRPTGLSVAVYDAMPAMGRKFLRAGVGGLNLTHSEPEADFLQRYHPVAEAGQWVSEFGAREVIAWAAALGIETFQGSSGRVFPVHKKASPLLRAWLRQLQTQGATFHTRHRWQGWQPQLDDQGQPCQLHLFSTPHGDIHVRSRATVLALGGGSWARLGSDGAWSNILTGVGVDCQPFQASNCGFDVAWSAHLQQQFAGAPLKSVALQVMDGEGGCIFNRRGEALVSRHGIQGSVVYTASRVIQQQIAQHGQCTLVWDLLPDSPADSVLARLVAARGKESRSNFLRKRLGLTGIKLALLYELAPAAVLDSPQQLATWLKALPLVVTRPRPLDEAISTTGGIALTQLNEALMLKRHAGVFCAGEMLDWDAPTGGYLLTACLASGRLAALGVSDFLR